MFYVYVMAVVVDFFLFQLARQGVGFSPGFVLLCMALCCLGAWLNRPEKKDAKSSNGVGLNNPDSTDSPKHKRRDAKDEDF